VIEYQGSCSLLQSGAHAMEQIPLVKTQNLGIIPAYVSMPKINEKKFVPAFWIKIIWMGSNFFL
jgi:hypothetical protein